MTDKQNFEKDINVPSKRFDYTDKIHTELANYEQMERDIEKIIEPYQTEIEAEAFSLPTAIESILERKEQECERLKLQLAHSCHDVLYKNSLAGKLDQLKAEYEVLEKVNQKNQEKIKKLNEQLDEEFINYQYGNEALFFELEDYKQALRDIKKIAEDESYVGFWDEQISEILQKISEVLDEKDS